MLVAQAAVYRCSSGHEQFISGWCARCDVDGRRSITSPGPGEGIWRDIVSPRRDLASDPWPGDELISDHQRLIVLGVGSRQILTESAVGLLAVTRHAWRRIVASSGGVLVEASSPLPEHDPVADPQPGDVVAWIVVLPVIYRVDAADSRSVACTQLQYGQTSRCFFERAAWEANREAIRIAPQLVKLDEPPAWRVAS